MTSLKHWPKESRPSERLQRHSPVNLSISELLSILIGTGDAQHNAVELAMRLLDHFHHDLDKLSNASVQELMNIKGIGKAKAATIVAALELGRRARKEAPPDRHFIRNSGDSGQFCPLTTGRIQASRIRHTLSRPGWLGQGCRSFLCSSIRRLRCPT